MFGFGTRSSLLALGFCSLHFSWDESIHTPPDSSDFIEAQSIVKLQNLPGESVGRAIDSSQLKLSPENPEPSKDERLSNPNVSAGTRI
ncbi:MAG: hypothetical protein LBF66_02695 [Holosporales bacterium]|jgi:hypothetical protein|nr:hypothetical protein [Holosporales bacterium]